MNEALDIEHDLCCASGVVGLLWNLAPHVFTGPKKGPTAHVQARQVLCYLLLTDAGHSHAAIARILKRNRSTVTHAIDVVTALRENEVMDEKLDRLGQIFRELRDARAAVPDLMKELAA